MTKRTRELAPLPPNFWDQRTATRQQAAVALGVSLSSLDRLIKNGHVKTAPRLPGLGLRVLVSSLKRLLADEEALIAERTALAAVAPDPLPAPAAPSAKPWRSMRSRRPAGLRALETQKER